MIDATYNERTNRAEILKNYSNFSLAQQDIISGLFHFEGDPE